MLAPGLAIASAACKNRGITFSLVVCLAVPRDGRRDDRGKIMSLNATAAQVLDREFLTIRGKLLEVAAALDRVERGQGSVAGDSRLEKIRETLAILAKDGTDRAEKLQLEFSLPYQPAWRKA